jgi:arylsulfatase A-like enzyme
LYEYTIHTGSKVNIKNVTCVDCNLIIISIDPLRVSNMSLYGYDKPTTPNIDRLSERALVFTNAVSVSSWTLPSAMSMFTGVYPSNHKITNKYTISEDKSEKLSNLNDISPDLLTMAQLFKEGGYKTGGFTGGAALDKEFGFDKGFDVYDSKGEFGGFDLTIPDALDWIEKNKGEKFFVYLQGYDTHGQYFPVNGYDKRFLDFDYNGTLTGSKEEQKSLREEGIVRGQVYLTEDDGKFLVALYDEKIQEADKKVGDLLDKLKQMGIFDKTIILLTSNHGDEFYEHGRIDHGHSLYDELVKIPLLILIPGMEKKDIIGSQVGNIDIFPTVLSMVGIDKEKYQNYKMDGISLLPLIQNKQKGRDYFLESDYRYASFLRGIRSIDGWKFIINIENGVKELYDLKKDPYEKNNLYPSDKNAGKILEEELQKFLKDG